MISVYLLVLIIKFVFEEVFQMCIESQYIWVFLFNGLGSCFQKRNFWCVGTIVRTHFIDCIIQFKDTVSIVYCQIEEWGCIHVCSCLFEVVSLGSCEGVQGGQYD